MGNMCESLCKSRKGPTTKKTPEELKEFQKKLDDMLGIKKVEDLI
jgi:hypothetical protein